mmetsp:Transcript_16382/g.28653  ORF Transcript_16382/g.28653 Transcript_16382/m.28653 type:complete len:238 (+) Transcript_16382:1011-1724(+)
MGVLPSRSLMSFLAPLSMRAATTFTLPVRAAMCSADQPFLGSWAWMSALFSSRKGTSSTLPWRAASNSAWFNCIVSCAASSSSSRHCSWYGLPSLSTNPSVAENGFPQWWHTKHSGCHFCSIADIRLPMISFWHPAQIGFEIAEFGAWEPLFCCSSSSYLSRQGSCHGKPSYSTKPSWASNGPPQYLHTKHSGCHFRSMADTRLPSQGLPQPPQIGTLAWAAAAASAASISSRQASW